jgi:hypothetical protein
MKIMPQSRKHLIWVKSQLETVSYDLLINKKYEVLVNQTSVNVIVKSYFWASRLIYDCHCLPRSIALYQQLKSLGFDVKHKFGVNNSDEKFAAHAWVEYQDKPLNESEDLKKKFTVLNQSNGS